jgi:integrase
MSETTKLSEYLDEWVETVIKPNVALSTYVSYEGNIRNHISPALGNTLLPNLTTLMIQRFVNELGSDGKGLSSASVRVALSVLHNALDYAESCDCIDKNPCRKIRKQRIRQAEVNAFSRSEQKQIEAFIDLSGDNRLVGVLLSLYTGLRLGEVCALKWVDIDRDNCKLEVRATMKRVTNGIKHSACSVAPMCPKTPQSRRSVPVPTFILERLDQIRERHSGEYVVSASNGLFVNPRTLQQLYKKLLQKAGISYKNFHVCRHTYATRAIELGVDIKTVSVCLGHSNSMITLNRYVHSLEEQKQKVVSIFDSFHTEQNKQV